jgi:hypothetical protein
MWWLRQATTFRTAELFADDRWRVPGCRQKGARLYAAVMTPHTAQLAAFVALAFLAVLLLT